MLRLCAAEGIAWVPFFPLGGTFPGLPKVTDEPAVHAVAEFLGATPSQVGLAWLLRHAPNVLLIPGTADAAHLEANMAASKITFDAAALAALDAIESRSNEVPIADRTNGTRGATTRRTPRRNSRPRRETPLHQALRRTDHEGHHLPRQRRPRRSSARRP